MRVIVVGGCGRRCGLQRQPARRAGARWLARDQRRLHDLGGQATSDEALVAMAVSVARNASAVVAERPTGQVIDLAAARAARAPHPVNHVVVFLSDDVVERLTALARRPTSAPEMMPAPTC